MFVVRNSQIEAFKVPIRKRNRDRMLMQLQSNGFNVKEGDGNELVIEDSRTNETRLIFDEKYVPQKIVKPSGLEYVFSFDKDDHLVRLRFPGDESIGFNYRNDLLKAIQLNGGRIGFNHDEKGRITEVVSQDDRRYKIGYNISAQVETITNRANEPLRFDSAIKGKHIVHSMTDSLGRVTQVETDPMGEAGDKISFPDGTAQTSVYNDNVGALVTTLRGGAKVLTYYHSPDSRSIEWEDDNFQNIELDGERVKAIENPTGSIRFEYDEEGRVLSEDFQGNKTGYRYDDDGNLTEMIYPSGLVVGYTYDEDGRLKTLNVGDDTCTYVYGANDTVEKIQYPNGLIQKRAEKVLGGLQSATLSDTKGQILSKQAYEYDKLYRLSRYTDIGTSSQDSVKDWQFSYDAEGRLLTSLEMNSQAKEHFEYDLKGNLVTANRLALKVGEMDQVISAGGNAVQYDANGNVRTYMDARGRSVRLQFNDNNELRFARIGADTWEYWYDGLGRRVGKSNGRETYKFCWGSEKLLAEEVHMPDGSSTVREYIYGANGTVPVAFREAGSLLWMHSDVRGAVTQVFDPSGQVVWSAGYSAFGEATLHQNRIRQPWRLTGQYYDIETGLHYITARYYSPYLKSFLSLDKYWFKYEAGNYGYAGNDPWNKIDKDGNLPESLKGPANFGVDVASAIAGTVAQEETLAIGVAAIVLLPFEMPVLAVAALGIAAVGTSIAVGAAVSAAINSVGKSLVEEKHIYASCVLTDIKNAVSDALTNPLSWILSKIPGAKGPRVTAPKANVSTATSSVAKAKMGGRLGNEATRKQIYDIGTDLENQGYTVTGGGGRQVEEYLRPIVGGRKGGSYVDITATHPEKGTIRINTVDVNKHGMPTLRESTNAERIRNQIGSEQELILIPKK